MEKVKIVEISSGFGNVPNNVILAENYVGAVCNRPGSAYDKFYTIELPNGFEIAENIAGERMLWHGKNHVEISSINPEKGWATGVSLDGFHHFPIVNA